MFYQIIDGRSISVEMWKTLFQMEEEEHTDRKQQLAAIYQKLNKIKKSMDEGMGDASSSSSSLLLSARTHQHCFVVQLLQMTQPTLTRLSALTHPSHASPIWWSWRRNGLLTRMRSASQDSWPVIPGCFPACLWETTVKTRAMPGCWSDLQNSKRE